MSELLPFIASFTAGTLLGLVFFWSLWATVQQLEGVRRPAVLMLGSLLLRFGLALAAFYFLARYAGWQHLLTAVAGFTLPRLVMVRRAAQRRFNREPDA
jgi:F1F0 ATPase subunit 2